MVKNSSEKHIRVLENVKTTKIARKSNNFLSPFYIKGRKETTDKNISAYVILSHHACPYAASLLSLFRLYMMMIYGVPWNQHKPKSTLMVGWLEIWRSSSSYMYESIICAYILKLYIYAFILPFISLIPHIIRLITWDDCCTHTTTRARVPKRKFISHTVSW